MSNLPENQNTVTINEFAKRLAQACAQVEGFFLTAEQAARLRKRFPTAAQRHNNPGNIMDLAYYRQTKKFRLQRFGTVAEGWRAAENWWKRRIREGKTLAEATAIYAPRGHGDNDPELYARLVAESLAIAPDVPLNRFIEGDSDA